jgi:hypothetical protein
MSSDRKNISFTLASFLACLMLLMAGFNFIPSPFAELITLVLVVMYICILLKNLSFSLQKTTLLVALLSIFCVAFLARNFSLFSFFRPVFIALIPVFLYVSRGVSLSRGVLIALAFPGACVLVVTVGVIVSNPNLFFTPGDVANLVEAIFRLVVGSIVTSASYVTTDSTYSILSVIFVVQLLTLGNAFKLILSFIIIALSFYLEKAGMTVALLAFLVAICLKVSYAEKFCKAIFVGCLLFPFIVTSNMAIAVMDDPIFNAVFSKRGYLWSGFLEYLGSDGISRLGALTVGSPASFQYFKFSGMDVYGEFGYHSGLLATLIENGVFVFMVGTLILVISLLSYVKSLPLAGRGVVYGFIAAYFLVQFTDGGYLTSPSFYINLLIPIAVAQSIFNSASLQPSLGKRQYSR